MSNFKVTSGEFVISIEEDTHRKAADRAIKIHDERDHPAKLGKLTLVEKLNDGGHSDGQPIFICTKTLIDHNTSGFGDGTGQYSEDEQHDSG